MILAEVTFGEVLIMLVCVVLGLAWAMTVHHFLKGKGYDAEADEAGSEGKSGH